MLQTIRSLLLICCVLVISRITVATDIDCKVPPVFTVEISHNERVSISRGKLNIHMREDEPNIYSYLETNSLEIRAKEAIITFGGDMKINDDNNATANEPKKIFVKFVDRISGIGHRVTENSLDSGTRDCRVVLLPTENNSSSLHVDIASEIHRIAESCLEFEICSGIESSKNIEQSLFMPDETSRLSIEDRDSLITGIMSETRNFLNFQKNINKLVDEGLAEFTDELRKNNGGNVAVPDIELSFSTGSGIFKTTGELHGKYGKFGDLTTTRRKSDAFLNGDGHKFIASCSFGPDKAQFIYDYYTLRYGSIRNIHGWMSGTMGDLIIKGSVSVDYNQKPCATALESLKVTQLGGIKIRMTGLSFFLNWILDLIANRVISDSSADIARTIEDNVRSIAMSKLSEFNCEKFRPNDTQNIVVGYF